jgi:hypothetical protein
VADEALGKLSPVFAAIYRLHARSRARKPAFLSELVRRRRLARWVFARAVPLKFRAFRFVCPVGEDSVRFATLPPATSCDGPWLV